VNFTFNFDPTPVAEPVVEPVVQYPDVMIDTETMGTRPDAPIIAIGIVPFNLATGEIGKKMSYMNIDLASTMALGAKPDAGTLMWWLTQSDKARQNITQGYKVPVAEALLAVTNFLTINTVAYNDRKVWACGTDFDVVKLAEHYHRCNLEVPWKYYNARDFRTVRELWPEIAAGISRTGTHHNALDDALYQVEVLIGIRKHLGSKGKL
jgi:hypothetical protein